MKVRRHCGKNIGRLVNLTIAGQREDGDGQVEFVGILEEAFVDAALLWTTLEDLTLEFVETFDKRLEIERESEHVRERLLVASCLNEKENTVLAGDQVGLGFALNRDHLSLVHARYSHRRPCLGLESSLLLTFTANQVAHEGAGHFQFQSKQPRFSYQQ